VDDQLIRITVLRHKPAYRSRLVAGTGLDNRVTTMRVLRSVSNLSAAGTSPSIGDVAERLQLDQSSASRAVDITVQQGYLRKVPSDVDGRRTDLVITDEGTRVLSELARVRTAVLEEIFADWEVDDVEKLLQLLSRLGDAYERLLAPRAGIKTESRSITGG